MNSAHSAELRAARARGSRARSVFDRRLTEHISPTLLNVEVHRSTSGAPYVDTLKDWRTKELSERVFVSEGASMLFWRTRTYRLVWLDF